MNDSDDEHPNVKFGMPLELYDENNLPSKQSSLPIHEQIVTDEEGRRRFHGAFTGGFSAGYYNTVGSKDGWTPSTFISSRKDKSKKKQSKPEDYMDEEDMGEYGIATKTIKAKQTFTSTRKRDLHEEKLVKEHKENSTLFLGTQLLDSLVIPTKTSIGIKLLKKLGWKEGQGIGARVDAKKPLTGKVYGCQLPTNKEDNLFYENVSFAPKDVVPMPMTGKDDVHGIGYSGLDPTAALRGNIERSTAVQLHTKSGIKMSFKGQAFGVGAFEADDDDIYAVDCMDNYDIEMGEEKNPDNTYGWTKPLALTGGSRRDAITNRVVKEVRGFVAARMKKLLNRVVYPPPNLPADFDPHRRLKLHQQKIRIDNLQLQPSATGSVVGSIDEVGTKQLDANARRELLGDEMSVTSKSVFEFMSREDRERLQRLKDPKPPQPDVPQPTVPQPAVPQPTGSKTSTEKAPTLPSLPPVDPLKPMCDVSKLRPFADDPAKQRRYEEFERAIRRRNKDPYRGIVSTLTEWEKNQERQDFSRAAQVYLHLNNNFNSKFEKAKSSDDDKLEGSKRREARVFGALTREKIEWHPDPLLCKRFNVPDPYPDSDLVGVEPVSIFSSLREIERGFTKDLQTLREKAKINPPVAPPPPEDTSPADEDTEKKEEDQEEEEERPSMDLFKSIFAASEDEESSSDEEVEEEVDLKSNEKPPSPSTKPKSAYEVFKGPLNIPKTDPVSQIDKDTKVPRILEDIFPGSSTQDADLYGPAIPPDVSQKSSTNFHLKSAYSSSSSSELEFVEKKSNKQKKKKNKHKLKKKHKKQKKHKKS